MNSVPHCKILTQGFDLENWMEKRWKIGGQVDVWCWEVLQIPSALTTSLAIKTGTTSRSLVCTCSKSLRKLIESKYKQYCPSFPNRHLCRCLKQSYPKHRKVSSYGKHWQFLHGRAEVDWMCDSWVERYPPWSFTSTIKAGFWLSLHKHTWKPMYPGVSGSYLYLAKASHFAGMESSATPAQVCEQLKKMVKSSSPSLTSVSCLEHARTKTNNNALIQYIDKSS